MAAILFAILALPALTLGQQCSVPGECSGTGLGTEFFGTERECLDHCKAVAGCEWYTYDESIDYCHVLEDCTEVCINQRYS